ncbi:unnamed protein product [Musa banksii]
MLPSAATAPAKLKDHRSDRHRDRVVRWSRRSSLSPEQKQASAGARPSSTETPPPAAQIPVSSFTMNPHLPSHGQDIILMLSESHLSLWQGGFEDTTLGSSIFFIKPFVFLWAGIGSCLLTIQGLLKLRL